jgi:sulfopyruvate decarboxylase subunit beta
MSSDDAMDQIDCTRVVVESSPDRAAIISNLGVSSWILSAVTDRERNFYMRGAMGSTTPTGLGLALSTDDRVTVLDGDGSMLMSLGSLTTVSRAAPDNLVIVVMNNSEFATTGGQSTLASELNFAGVAEESGLEAWEATDISQFEAAYEAACEHDGPALVSAAVVSDVPDEYPRPDYAHSHHKHKFRTALLGE